MKTIKLSGKMRVIPLDKDGKAAAPDIEWLAMMLERVRQHAFSAGVFHSQAHSTLEDSESLKASEARAEIMAAAKEWFK